MNIKHWPEQERPCERLIRHGASSLSDAELLAILLGSGSQGHNAIDLARAMLSEFGNLRAIMQSNEKTICAFHGLGKIRYARIQVVLEMAKRSLLDTMKKGQILANPTKARDFLLLKMRDYKHEVFACLFLDNQHRVIAFEEMFRGTISGASVHPREIVKRALHHNAAAIIFAHNHPSGSSDPSKSDKHITQELKESLSLIDVRVLDHFVVGEDVTSFAEESLL